MSSVVADVTRDPQVLRSVVRLHPVDVVDVLARKCARNLAVDEPMPVGDGLLAASLQVAPLVDDRGALSRTEAISVERITMSLPLRVVLRAPASRYGLSRAVFTGWRIVLGTRLGRAVGSHPLVVQQAIAMRGVLAVASVNLALPHSLKSKPGLRHTRTQALKALGNAVVPQQAILALSTPGAAHTEESG